jgi:hypothetical protein
LVRVRVENPFLKERAAVRNKYQRKGRKSNHKLEVVGGQELLVRVPLPIAEVWAEMQAQPETPNRLELGRIETSAG